MRNSQPFRNWNRSIRSLLSYGGAWKFLGVKGSILPLQYSMEWAVMAGVTSDEWCGRSCLPPTLYSTETMPRGISIPESTCWVVVRMHTCHFSPEQIRLLTEISPRQQRRILKRFRKTDNVLADKNDPRLRGRPRQMMAEDVAVSSWFSLQFAGVNIWWISCKFLQNSINNTCDIYLDELKDSLGMICGKDVSESTIWRTLKRCGYRMKKVSKDLPSNKYTWKVILC